MRHTIKFQTYLISTIAQKNFPLFLNQRENFLSFIKDVNLIPVFEMLSASKTAIAYLIQKIIISHKLETVDKITEKSFFLCLGFRIIFNHK